MMNMTTSDTAEYFCAVALETWHALILSSAQLDRNGAIFVFCGLLVAAGLFALRLCRLGIYAACEVIFGFAALVGAAPRGRVTALIDGHAKLLAGFQMNAIQAVGAIYIIIRGLDNANGWRKESAKAAAKSKPNGSAEGPQRG